MGSGMLPPIAESKLEARLELESEIEAEIEIETDIKCSDWDKIECGTKISINSGTEIKIKSGNEVKTESEIAIEIGNQNQIKTGIRIGKPNTDRRFIEDLSGSRSAKPNSGTGYDSRPPQESPCFSIASRYFSPISGRRRRPLIASSHK
ncbi:hypothetical protein EVAR_16645_1 [Eumeta japonica]|uniref:Uncharacterized protein n=1 Tax=Eumeta variegata TaxID=151549 RepID=A0A4C1V048_EUMVA|nr:hypothetical protein EVAR_16645_1 [Eumeta japonica]